MEEKINGDEKYTTITIPVYLWQKIRHYQTEWRDPTLGVTISKIIEQWEEANGCTAIN